MSDYAEILKTCFESPFNISSYRNFIVNFLNGTVLSAANGLRSAETFTEFNYYVQGFAMIGEYTDPKGDKVGIFAIKLNKGRDIEKARSKQRNFIARLLKDYKYDAAIAAFYINEETKWRLSFARIDYEFINGKLDETLSPARRYSYLVGLNEPSHTAQESLLPIFANEDFKPTIDSIEQAFSVEKVTKQFFEKYRLKYIELKEYLEGIDCFNSEATLRGFTSEQFTKKLMGQIVFMYFLQKKGWLGVKAFPSVIDERAYKKAFFSNATVRGAIPTVYIKNDNGNYNLNESALSSLTAEQENGLARAIKGAAWGTGSKTFVRDLFNRAKEEGANFFDDYLEPLFYEALNAERSAGNYYDKLHCRIPFLNGGLFEPLAHYDWKNNSFSIPNEIFSDIDNAGLEADGVLDIFDRYNFTMNEDEPLEKEVAVDPEMLGKIFENLLDVKDRKSKGAFYTPREIVHYMCQESLTNYIVNTVGTPYEDTKKFVVYGEIMKDEDCSNEGTYGVTKLQIADEVLKKLPEIDNALKDVRVADPAVGSGAFPMGMVSEIVKLRNIITDYMARAICLLPKYKNSYSDNNLGGQLRAEIWKLRNDTRDPYKIKKETMRNSIYAVDIEPSAVDIAKLRLWLSLVVEQDIIPDDPEKSVPCTLPNLDCNIMCGNSLIDEYEGVDLSFNSILFGDTMQSNIWSNDIDTDLERLFVLQREYFYANNRDKKDELSEGIKAIKNKLIDIAFDQVDEKIRNDYYNEIMHPSTPFFLWKLNFAKVFKDKGGFDIVIGNPPYVGEGGNKELFRPIAQTRFGKNYYQGKMDFWYFFTCLGIDMLSNNGVLSFIAPNTWITSNGASIMRNKILNETTFIRYIDFSELKIFETAAIQTMIFCLKKHKTDVSALKYSKVKSPKIDNNELINILNGGVTANSETLTLSLCHNNFINHTISFNSNEYDIIFDKLKNNATYLTTAEIAQGIVVPQTSLNKKNKEILGEGYTVNEGIFVLSRDEVDKLNLSNDELSLVKPYYDTTQLMKYFANKATDYFIIYTNRQTNEIIDNYPNIKKHLDRFVSINTSDNKPYGLHRARDEAFFKGNKVLVARKCIEPTFTYFDGDCYVLQTFNIIKTDRFNLQFLTGLLNSTLIKFWLSKKGKRQGANYQIDREPLMEIPINIIDASLVNSIANLTLSIIEKNEVDSVVVKNIDNLVYQLYGLTPEEIALVESSIK